MRPGKLFEQEVSQAAKALRFWRWNFNNIGQFRGPKLPGDFLLGLPPAWPGEHSRWVLVECKETHEPRLEFDCLQFSARMALTAVNNVGGLAIILIRLVDTRPRAWAVSMFDFVRYSRELDRKSLPLRDSTRCPNLVELVRVSRRSLAGRHTGPDAQIWDLRALYGFEPRPPLEYPERPEPPTLKPPSERELERRRLAIDFFRPLAREAA